jgi:hypothetical protein
VSIDEGATFTEVRADVCRCAVALKPVIVGTVVSLFPSWVELDPMHSTPFVRIAAADRAKLGKAVCFPAVARSQGRYFNSTPSALGVRKRADKEVAEYLCAPHLPLSIMPPTSFASP